MVKVFISHSSKDAQIVKSLIDDLLVGALTIKIGEIFCTSIDGTKIKSGDDWRNSIQAAIHTAPIALLIVTPHYKESEMCIAEMGAAWMASGKVIPFIVEPITYSTVGVIHEPTQVEKLLDSTSLDRLRDVVQEKLNIDSKDIKSDRWSTKKIEFITKVKQHLVAHPFGLAVGRDEFDKLVRERDDQSKAIDDFIRQISERDQLINDLKDAKDANDVKIIEKKYAKTSALDEFVRLCKHIEELLTGFTAIVRGIIFCDWSGKELRVEYRGNESQIDDAISKDHLTSEAVPDWTTTKKMRKLKAALQELDSFMGEQKLTPDFVRQYDEQYEAPMSLANRDFWEEVFRVNVYIA